jgi:hypothetical protein
MNLDLELFINLPIQNKLRDLSLPLERFGQVWKNHLSVKQFEREETADGNKWKPLSPSYSAQKKRMGYSLAIGKATQETFQTRGYTPQRDGIRLGYDTPQARYFDRDRPLFTRSSSIPGSYQVELSKQITVYLNE